MIHSITIKEPIYEHTFTCVITRMCIPHTCNTRNTMYA